MPLGHLVGSCSLQSASEPFIEEPKSQHLSWVVIYFQLLPFPKIWSQFEIFKKFPFNWFRENWVQETLVPEILDPEILVSEILDPEIPDPENLVPRKR